MRLAFLKLKSRPEAALGSRDPRSLRSTLGVLLAPPRLVQADLLSLHFARIARHESGRAERRLERRIILDQGARKAVPNRAGLAVFAAAAHVHLDVEGCERLGDLERLAHDHAARFAREEFVHRLAIDLEQALAGLEEYPRCRAFATARAVVVIADHQISSAFGCCAACGCVPSA